MLIHRMSATFGKLQGRTLELREGLNILQAPNETGKSTWCAFLLSMLYGINSRERDKAGFIADKNRYAPWSGTSMSGRIDCRIDGQDLTLLRSTRRQTAPMGEFQALYTGTGDPVPNLTGTSAGENLLGVSREVFERSAFIRQSGLAISQDAGLERRIAALITSGEEDTSYTEAAETLKKQLNRRRHNRTGQLPVLEGELQDILRQIIECEELELQLAEAQRLTDTLALQETALLAEQEEMDRWDIAQKHLSLEQEKAAAQAKQELAETLLRRIHEDRIPENDTIARLRGAIVNLTTVRKSADKARAERDDALKVLLQAETALNESPFAGQTPEQARREVENPPRSKTVPIPAILAVYGAAAAVVIALTRLFPDLPDGPALLFIGFPLILLSALLSALLVKRARSKARRDTLTKRFGTADQSEIETLADAYCKLYEDWETAQSDLSAKSATADALHVSLASNEQGILLEIRRFAPSAFDLSTADSLLRSCAQRRKEATEAETAAREAALRYELLRHQMPVAPKPEEPVTAPTRDQNTVSSLLENTRVQLAGARSTADRLAGQLQERGSSTILLSSAQHLKQQIDGLETEYYAIRMAMEALEAANTTLQNRFSPALGHRAAEIFRELTGGTYNGVVLDRSFHLSAEPTGDTMYRDAGLLSAGTVDQLYLATRLAICDLVLPENSSIPLILDDALTNFDDLRCAAALRWLKKESKHRQILLFTCHSREAEFFAGDEEVFVQQLTDTL